MRKTRPVNVGVELYEEVRVRAFHQRRTMKDLVEEALIRSYRPKKVEAEPDGVGEETETPRPGAA